MLMAVIIMWNKEMCAYTYSHYPLDWIYIDIAFFFICLSFVGNQAQTWIESFPW